MSHNFCDHVPFTSIIKLHVYIQGRAKKGPIQVLHYNSILRYAIALNFGKNTARFALNSNWYNLASIIQYNFFFKPFHI